jgi:hypothetical protein
MAPSHRIAIYGNGLFNDTTPPYEEQLQQMQASSFTTVVLWALHVHDDGDFYFNDTRAVSGGQWLLGDTMPQLLTQLRDASQVTEVVMSIGPFASDFEAIVANPASANANFTTLASTLSLDAIDFDYEGGDSTTTIVEITEMVDALGLGVTYCPYTDEELWLACLAQVYQDLGRQPVRWYNLQCYDGGAGNDPVEWAQSIANYGQPLGIDDPAAFVLPGYWVKNNGPKPWYGKCPSELESQFSDRKSVV